jgi:hypothetical protein
VIVLGGQAHAQERDLVELLSGRRLPLQMQLKELGNEWRRITVTGHGSVSGNVSVNVNGNASGAVSQNTLTGAILSSRSYVKKGETVTAQGRAYLVAYHLPVAGLDIGKLLQAVASKAAPSGAALTPETNLPLSLLDLQSIGSIEDVTPFDAQAAVTESEQALRALADLVKSQSGGGSTNSPAKAESGK